MVLGCVYGDKLLFSGQGNIASEPMRFEPVVDRIGKLLVNLFANLHANNVNPRSDGTNCLGYFSPCKCCAR